MIILVIIQSVIPYGGDGNEVVIIMMLVMTSMMMEVMMMVTITIYLVKRIEWLQKLTCESMEGDC